MVVMRFCIFLVSRDISETSKDPQYFSSPLQNLYEMLRICTENIMQSGQDWTRIRNKSKPTRQMS